MYDLQMTRSIGDWFGPDVVLPHPECRCFTVTHSKWVRLILASDGLWSVCSHARAITRARGCATAAEAASSLLDLVESHFAAKGRRTFSDDVSIVVVDINPSLLNYQPPSAFYVAGCSISSPGCMLM